MTSKAKKASCAVFKLKVIHFKICVCIPKLHEAGDEFTAKSCKDIRTFAQQLNVKENSTY